MNRVFASARNIARLQILSSILVSTQRHKLCNVSHQHRIHEEEQPGNRSKQFWNRNPSFPKPLFTQKDLAEHCRIGTCFHADMH